MKNTEAYLVASEVWLEFAGKDFEGCRLADSVGAHQTEDFTCTGNVNITLIGMIFQTNLPALGVGSLCNLNEF